MNVISEQQSEQVCPEMARACSGNVEKFGIKKITLRPVYPRYDGYFRKKGIFC